MTDIFSKEKRSELMRLVKTRDTNIELIVRKELSKRGYRFRIKSNVFGKPDIVFKSRKVAIFCDGDFWHGKNYKKEHSRYEPFWVEKIERNMIRDKLVNKTLKKEGWTVLRFWKSEILKNIENSVDKIETELLKDGSKGA